jgi:hypothetical protein
MISFVSPNRDDACALARMARSGPGTLARRSELPDQPAEYVIPVGIAGSRLVLGFVRRGRQVSKRVGVDNSPDARDHRLSMERHASQIGRLV